MRNQERSFASLRTSTFGIAVNLKTAKTLGLTMPPEIMVRATRVIE